MLLHNRHTHTRTHSPMLLKSGQPSELVAGLYHELVEDSNMIPTLFSEIRFDESRFVWHLGLKK